MRCRIWISIKHSDILEAVRFFLMTSGLDLEFAEFILRLLEFALSHNFFLFRESYYLQLQGTAMVASCAPSYANLFLGWWERSIFLTDPVPLEDRVQTWFCYIDNGIIIWQDSILELEEFIGNLNRNTPNTKPIKLVEPIWFSWSFFFRLMNKVSYIYGSVS